MIPNLTPLPESYPFLLKSIRESIEKARVKAALAVNREMIKLYWEIGKAIVVQQEKEGWGKAVVDRLAKDLQAEFPGENGFSSRNLWYMRTFYVAYNQDITILQQPVAELGKGKLQQPVAEIGGVSVPPVLADIPWGHNISLLEKLEDPEERLWYARKAAENGWSRAVMVHQIETDLIRREGAAMTNFTTTLPAPQSELAQQIMKDPYQFNFLNLGTDFRERELEQALLNRMKDFLLELGSGFSFVGSQYHLEIGGLDYYIDLLFYHLKLKRFIVIDLKIEDFQPEYIGK